MSCSSKREYVFVSADVKSDLREIALLVREVDSTSYVYKSVKGDDPESVIGLLASGVWTRCGRAFELVAGDSRLSGDAKILILSGLRSACRSYSREAVFEVLEVYREAVGSERKDGSVLEELGGP